MIFSVFIFFLCITPKKTSLIHPSLCSVNNCASYCDLKAQKECLIAIFVFVVANLHKLYREDCNDVDVVVIKLCCFLLQTSDSDILLKSAYLLKFTLEFGWAESSDVQNSGCLPAIFALLHHDSEEIRDQAGLITDHLPYSLL